MTDYELDEIRRIRQQVSASHGHELRKVAEYYRGVEKELRESGRYHLADERTREQPTPDDQAAEHSAGDIAQNDRVSRHRRNQHFLQVPLKFRAEKS